MKKIVLLAATAAITLSGCDTPSSEPEEDPQTAEERADAEREAQVTATLEQMNAGTNAEAFALFAEASNNEDGSNADLPSPTVAMGAFSQWLYSKIEGKTPSELQQLLDEFPSPPTDGSRDHFRPFRDQVETNRRSALRREREAS